MKADYLEVNPFSFTGILDIHVLRGVNQHGRAIVRGVIPEDAESKYVTKSLSNTAVEVEAVDLSGNRRVLFHGILEDMNIGVVNGLKVMELHVMSQSRLMDTTTGIKVFQDINLTYNNLVNAVMSPFSGSSVIMNCGNGQSIGEMFVQYQETVWEFLIRMSSMLQDVIVSNDTLPGLNLYFGFPKRASSNPQPISAISYEIKKNVGGYIYKKENKVPSVHESDSIYYVVKDREIRDLGEAVLFQGKKMCITAIESKMEGQEVVHFYTLMNLAGTKVPKTRNYRIIGASLSGNVSKVDRCSVKMKIPQAHSNNVGTVKLIPFSTVYSSPDGTGWYAMPEVGDTLRMYFPTEVEDDAYAISAVHINNAAKSPSKKANESLSETDSEESEGPRTNNDIKEISNNYGKKIELAPTYILMSSVVDKGDGSGDTESMSILLEDGKGITIVSDLDINITANENVNISSLTGMITATGAETVELRQDEALVKLTGGTVVFKGAKIITE